MSKDRNDKYTVDWVAIVAYSCGVVEVIKVIAINSKVRRSYGSKKFYRQAACRTGSGTQTRHVVAKARPGKGGFSKS